MAGVETGKRFKVFLRRDDGLQEIGSLLTWRPPVTFDGLPMLFLAMPPETERRWLMVDDMHPSDPGIYLDLKVIGSSQMVLICKPNDDEDLFDRDDFTPI